MNKYTSLKLSKWLQDNGFEGESNMWWTRNWYEEKYELVYYEYTTKPKSKVLKIIAPAYDILNDLCVRYGKELFGEKLIYSREHHLNEIFKFLQQNKKDEAEEYIRKHCKFNPNNK